MFNNKKYLLAIFTAGLLSFNCTYADPAALIDNLMGDDPKPAVAQKPQTAPSTDPKMKQLEEKLEDKIESLEDKVDLLEDKIDLLQDKIETLEEKHDD